MVERTHSNTPKTPCFRIRGDALEVLILLEIPGVAEFRDYAEIDLEELEGMSLSDIQNHVEESCCSHLWGVMCGWGIRFDVRKYQEMQRERDGTFEGSKDFDVCPECDAVHRAGMACHQCEEGDPDAFESLAEEWERIDNGQYEEGDK